MLDSEIMQDVIQKHAIDSLDFKLEEHQIPCLMSPGDYGNMTYLKVDNILAERAKKAGKSHALSAWQYS